MVLAGFFFSLVPGRFIQKHLGNPSLISLATLALLSTTMYVSAVSHIPFIATLIASGAAPGVAVIFLMAAATDIPELYTIRKMIGKRSALIYTGLISIYAFSVGMITNWILMLDFILVGNSIDQLPDYLEKSKLLGLGDLTSYFTSGLVLVLFFRVTYPDVRKFWERLWSNEES